MSPEPTTVSWSRRAALALLRVFFRRRGGGPIPPERVRRVLLIRHDRIGDAVITTPLLAALKYVAPDAEIDVLASPANSAIFSDDPRVSRVLVWRSSPLERLRVFRAGRRRNYDLVYQLILGRTTLPAILAGILAPRGIIIGKSMPGHDELFDNTVVIPDTHFSDRTSLLLGGGIRLDAPLPVFPYSITIPPASRERAERMLAAAGLDDREFVLLNISAGSPARELADEQNIRLARGLASSGFAVAVTGGPEASGRMERIASAAGAQALRFGSILDAAAGMERSCLVVTPDTGTLHIAAAVGTAVVAMFPAHGHPEGWAPRDVPFRVVRATIGDHLGTIDLDDVAAAANALLADIRMAKP